MPNRLHGAVLLVSVLGLGTLVGCSGSGEDVRITLCKNLTAAALQLDAESIEWIANDNRFFRPEYAITGLRLRAKHEGATEQQTACYFEHEVLDETAVSLADPLSAYANLPFRMSVNGVDLGDAGLLKLVNAEQRRLGRQVITTLGKGVDDAAEKIKSSAGY